MKIKVTCWSYINKVFCRGELFFACTMQKHCTNWLLSTQNVLITKLLNFKFYLILPAGNHSFKSLSLKHFLRLKHRKKIFLKHKIIKRKRPTYFVVTHVTKSMLLKTTHHSGKIKLSLLTLAVLLKRMSLQYY